MCVKVYKHQHLRLTESGEEEEVTERDRETDGGKQQRVKMAPGENLIPDLPA